MIEINNQFIKQHDRLVRVIVNQFKVANVDPEDLMQEGRIGLIEAAKRFDPNRGIQFASYASWWIRGYITKGLSDYGNTIHIPKHEKEAINLCVSMSFDDILYIEEGDPITFADTLTDGSTVETEYIDTENRRAQRRDCEARIANLKPKEQIVIRGLYGFDGKRKTTQKLAKEFGVTQDWIQDIHERSLKKMR